jgi:hypothetical protein
MTSPISQHYIVFGSMTSRHDDQCPHAARRHSTSCDVKILKGCILVKGGLISPTSIMDYAIILNLIEKSLRHIDYCY